MRRPSRVWMQYFEQQQELSNRLAAKAVRMAEAFMTQRGCLVAQIEKVFALRGCDSS
jgi:hypothetical protein